MSELEPELGPEQEESLRALLADLGSAGEGADPLPADVAARLEDTLRGLVAEPDTSRSHSRWRPRLAVAAAAVVVLGLGGVAVGQLGRSADQTTSTDSSGGSAAQSKPNAQTPSPSSKGSSEQSSGLTSGQSSARTPVPPSGKSASAARLPELSTAGFSREVTALLGSHAALRLRGAEDSTATSRKAPADTSTCAGPPITDGARITRVALDSAPAALVVHPPRGGKRLVEAWSCDGTHRLASTTIAP